MMFLVKHPLGCQCGRCPTKNYAKKPVSQAFKTAVSRRAAALPKGGKECGICGFRGRHKFSCIYYSR